MQEICIPEKVPIVASDCRDFLRSIRGQADLVFADPPFNIGRNYPNWSDILSEPQYETFTQEWLQEASLSLNMNGLLCVHIPDQHVPLIFEKAKKLKLRRVDWIIWHYRFGQHTDARFIDSRCHCLVFGAGVLNTWNPDAVLVDSDRNAVYGDWRTDVKENGTPGKRVPLNTWYGKNLSRIQGNNKERRPQHDNQLPEMYLSRIIRAYTNQGDLVVDPFCGSGTTAVVADGLRRRFLGCDNSPANVRWAEERRAHGAIRNLLED